MSDETVPGEGALGADGADGADGASADWREGLSEDLRGAPALADFKDVGSLAKSYLETKRLVGDSIRVPSSEAGAADWEAFRAKLIDKEVGLAQIPTDPEDTEAWAALYKSLGAPEAPDAYSAPENVEADPQVLEELRTAAHKARLTKKQFDAMLGELHGKEKQRTEAQQAQHQTGLETLKGEWGAAFEARRAQAAQIARATGAPEGLQKALDTGGAGAETLRWMHSLAKAFAGEGAVVAQQVGAGTTALSPEEARGRAEELRTRLLEMKKSDPSYTTLTKRMVEYHRLAQR
jgi:hypothetical protein